jgi:hypothetical protein
MTGGRLARDISRAVPKQQAFAVEALVKVLERRGLVPRAEVLEEIKRLRAQAPKAR